MVTEKTLSDAKEAWLANHITDDILEVTDTIESFSVWQGKDRKKNIKKTEYLCNFYRKNQLIGKVKVSRDRYEKFARGGEIVIREKDFIDS